MNRDRSENRSSLLWGRSFGRRPREARDGTLASDDITNSTELSKTSVLIHCQSKRKHIQYLQTLQQQSREVHVFYQPLNACRMTGVSYAFPKHRRSEDAISTSFVKVFKGRFSNPLPRASNNSPILLLFLVLFAQSSIIHSFAFALHIYNGHEPPDS